MAEETYYPKSSTSDEFDYDRPQYTSYAEPSAYSEDVLDNEYKSYAGPKPRPAPPSYGGPPPSEPGYGYDGPKPSYGGHAVEREYGSGGGSGYGGRTEHGRPEPEDGSGYGRKPEYGSGYGRRPDYDEPGYGRRPESEIGSGYGRQPEYERPSSEYGSGYGRKSECEEPPSEYSSGYGRKPSSEYGGSGSGSKPESEEYGSGGYWRRPENREEESGGGYGYGRKPERSEYEEQPSYGQPTYQTEGLGRPSYGRSEEEDYRKPSYERRDNEDEGYGPKKYGYDNSDDEDEEKRRHRHHHLHQHREIEANMESCSGTREADFRCVQCGFPIKTLYIQYSPGNIRLMKCGNCKAIADEYIECEMMILIIDLILHKPKAYSHLFYNMFSKKSVNFESLLWKSVLAYLILDFYRIWILSTNEKEWSLPPSVASLLLKFGKMLTGVLVGNLVFLCVMFHAIKKFLNASSGFYGWKQMLLVVLVSSYFKIFLMAMMVWDFPSSVIFIVDIFVISSNIVALKVITNSEMMRCLAVCAVAHGVKFLVSQNISVCSPG